MKKLQIRKFAIILLGLLVISSGANAQILKKIGKSAKQQAEQKVKEKAARETREALDKTEKKLDDAVNDATSKKAQGDSKSVAKGEVPRGTKDIYVSASNGSNRNDGSKASPLKDLQKAVDIAPEGAVIHVTEGNYLGNLDRGFVKITKYLSVVGGYSSDFSQRDPLKYKTIIQPGATAGGTNANNGLLDIYVRGKRKGLILVDGFILDKGQMNRYVSLSPSDPRFTVPAGLETGILNPPGMPIGQPSMRGATSVSNQLIHGDVEGKVVIRNCVLMNGSHFGIQMGNIGGDWEIYNNVFVTNRMAACEVRGMNQTPGEATVEFHHNTVLFTWRRDWNPSNKDMGYGFRFMTRIDANVHHNIFGCNDFSALDRAYIDSDKNKEASRKTSAWENLFFSNIEADLTLPGAGKFMRVFAKQFEDVEQLIKYENNREINDAELRQLSKCIDEAYMKAFLTMENSTSMQYNPNSSANQFRSALGMNQVGTSRSTVSMYGNAYPFDKVTLLFGAINGYGAQKP